MKVLAVLLIVLAGIISLVPQFTSCESQGLHLVLENGRQVSMKCHWTARAELAMGVPFGVSGVFLFWMRRKETKIALGVIGALFGVFTILLPTALIGVCANPDMLCNAVMKPTLILAGSLAIGTGLAVMISALNQREPAPTL